LERRLLHRDVGNVDHYDGWHDGALRYSYGSYLRLHRSKAPSSTRGKKTMFDANPESAEAAKSNMYDNSPSTDDDRRRAITRRGQPRRQSSFVGPI
jgi:hypothetical protein